MLRFGTDSRFLSIPALSQEIILPGSAFPFPENRVIPLFSSAFRAAERDSFDELLLENEEYENQRNDRQERARHDQWIVSGILPVQCRKPG